MFNFILPNLYAWYNVSRRKNVFYVQCRNSLVIWNVTVLFRPPTFFRLTPHLITFDRWIFPKWFTHSFALILEWEVSTMWWNVTSFKTIWFKWGHLPMKIRYKWNDTGFRFLNISSYYKWHTAHEIRHSTFLYSDIKKRFVKAFYLKKSWFDLRGGWKEHKLHTGEIKGSED